MPRRKGDIKEDEFKHTEVEEQTFLLVFKDSICSLLAVHKHKGKKDCGYNVESCFRKWQT